MIKQEMRAAFLDALNSGKEKINAIDNIISDILNIINEANFAISSMYQEASFKGVVKEDDFITSIAVHINIRGDLISRRVMDIEINQKKTDVYYVTWAQGTTPVNKSSELAEIFQSLFSSPTFLISIEKMIKSTE